MRCMNVLISAAVFVLNPVLCLSGGLEVIRSGPGAGHYLSYHGEPVFLIGDSVTQGWVESGEDFKQQEYVEALARRGIRVLLLWSFIAPQTGGDPRIGYDAPDLLPWVKTGPTHWDLSRFEERYFERLADLCKSARERKICVIIQVFDGWTKTRFSTHPFNRVNGGPLSDRSQFVDLADYENEMPTAYNPSWNRLQRNQYFQERFAARLIEATSAFENVAYELFNEGEWYDREKRKRHELHFLAFFKARCSNLLLTNADHIGGFDFRLEPKTDVISLHLPNWSCSTSVAVSFQHYRARFAGTPPKPFFFSEPVPEFRAENPCEVEALTRLMWGTALAGAGFVVQNDASFGFNPKARIASRAALRDLMLDREGACSRFFNELGVNWVEMAPDPSVSSTRVALAAPGTEYVIYSQSGRTFTVDLKAYSGVIFSGRFYDPRSGELKSEQTFEGGKEITVTKPDSRDWVFWLRRSKGVSFRRGDANADSGVDIADAVLILSYLFAGADLPCEKAADANDDGKIDVADPVRVLSYLFAGGSPLPDPFNRCGADPTEDALSCGSFPPCRAG